MTQLVSGLARTVQRGQGDFSGGLSDADDRRALVRQAWDKWPLDVVFPMLYHSFYREEVDWIGRGAAEGVAALPASTPLIAGVYLPDLRPADLGRAVQVARDGGAAGVAMFEMGGLSDAHLAALRAVHSGA